jgi:hypothetical protein
MKNLRLALISISLFFSLLPLGIVAQWSTNPAVNNQICGLTGDQAIPKIATCANGDSYIGYFSNESGNYNVRLQRLNAQGYIQWAADGILISNNPQNTWLTDWDMTCDNANNCILAFNDIRSSGNTNVVVYRISPSGTFVWGANGILLSNSTAFNAAPKVVVTASGNAVFAWSSDYAIIIQKISPAGSLLWGPTGITLTSANRLTWPQLLPVGTDDVIMKYFDDSGPVYSPTRHVFAQRYNSSGTAVWSSPASISVAGGISAWTQIFPFVNDGSDGFYICWNDDRDNNQRSSVFVQHVNSSGVPQWTTNGVEVTNASSMNHYYPKMAFPPGSTDVYVFWNEMNGDQNLWGIYGQKVNSSGALQWGSSGMTFIPVSTLNVYPYEARCTPTDVVLFYEEYFTAINGSIKAMRISPSGSFVWTPSIKTMCSVNSEKVHPFVNEFANNQWIASWEDNRNVNSDIYAQNIQLNGDLGPYNTNYGTIAGTVTLSGGSGNVTEADVTAGAYSTHPDATGNYGLTVPAGTYSVTASHPYTTTDTIPNVVVISGQNTTGINFTLTINRADLICSAICNILPGPLNNVDVVIQGPEGPYTGTILNDSLVFPHVPYGVYNGSATYFGWGPFLSDTTINEANHHMVFSVILDGITANKPGNDLRVNPNPAGPGSMITYSVPATGIYSFDLLDAQGRKTGALKNQSLSAGDHQLPLLSVSGIERMMQCFYLLRLYGDDGFVRTCKIVYGGK